MFTNSELLFVVMFASFGHSSIFFFSFPSSEEEYDKEEVDDGKWGIPII
jgi:hypothetical protein